MIHKVLTYIWCALSILPILSQAQIQVQDYSRVEEVRIEKYDSSYFQPNYKFDNLPVMNGLVGHTLIFLKEPMFNMGFEIFQKGIKQDSYNAFEKYLFQNCKIEKVVNGQFYLSCLGDSLMYKPSFTDQRSIVILEGFEKFKSRHINKQFFSLSTVKITSLENNEIQVVTGQALKIESIEIAKLDKYSLGLGFQFSNQNQNFTVGMPFGDSYLEYGGDPKGKIDFRVGYINMLEVVDESLNAVINKSLFKKNILKGEVVVGMTEKEIRIVWGMPTRDKMSAGFDKIMIYEAGGTTYYLYMKGKKLVKLSQL